MKKLLVAAVMMCASLAFAGGNNNDNGPTFGGGGDAIATQGQGQAQGQAQGQLQGQAQGIISSIDNDVRNRASAMVKQSVVVTDSGKMRYSGSYEVKNVPNVALGNIYPTSPCMGSSSVGAAGVGFGVSFGSSWTDDECGIRETARSFAGMDMKADAVKILCTSKYAAAAPACAAPAQQPAK